MPLPFLLIGVGAIGGALGVTGHIDAKETNKKAQRIADDAQEIYDDAKLNLEEAKEGTEKSLVRLGKAKKKILDTSMDQFLKNYDKVKHIEITESKGMDELSGFTIDQVGALEIRQLSDVYSASFQSAATGAALALAANGALPILSGGLGLAADAVLTGGLGLGAATGIVGTTLSMSLAVTPLTAMAAPVVFFTGLSASMKADENLEKANAMYAQAEEAVEKMKVAQVKCEAIAKRADMLDDLLRDLNKMFKECVVLMNKLIQKKEEAAFGKKLSVEDFSDEEIELLWVARSLAGALKAVIDTPMLTKKGNLAAKAEKLYKKTEKGIPEFAEEVKKVKKTNYAL